jgi:hypothetical protein
VPKVREKARTLGAFSMLPSLWHALYRTQNLKFLPKVSGQYLENSLFSETRGEDWFDLELRAGLGSESATQAVCFRGSAVLQATSTVLV